MNEWKLFIIFVWNANKNSLWNEICLAFQNSCGKLILISSMLRFYLSLVAFLINLWDVLLSQAGGGLIAQACFSGFHTKLVNGLYCMSVAMSLLNGVGHKILKWVSRPYHPLDILAQRKIMKKWNKQHDHPFSLNYSILSALYVVCSKVFVLCCIYWFTHVCMYECETFLLEPFLKCDFISKWVESFLYSTSTGKGKGWQVLVFIIFRSLCIHHIV